MRQPRLYLALLDFALLALAWALAYNFRFEFAVPGNDSLLGGGNYALQMKLLVLWVAATHVAIYWLVGIYRGLIRYAGTTELRGIILATAAHAAVWAGFNIFVDARESFFAMPQRQLGSGAIEVIRIPWGILMFYSAAAILATGGVRFVPRLFREAQARAESAEAPATLIVGAGDVADGILRNIARGSSDFRAVCAVTIFPARVGMRLHGVPVVATIDKIPQVIREYKIEKVLIALDVQGADVMRQVVGACENAQVTFERVPSLADLAEGKVEVSALREVEIGDLLGRDPVKFELPADKNYLRGATVLVTGAGGSIGSELCRQAAISRAAKIVLLGKGENSIFEIAQELRAKFPAVETVAAIADVRDAARLETVFRAHKPEIVVHAAAHKHVPLMEAAPDEAVKNNILGSWNVARLADQYRVQRFILISTDKAVRPTSVMGATKRFAEMIVFALAARSQTNFMAVRFGNVLGSRGSVIPLFRRQIAAGGPVTVTHPDVTRYFMTIPEAVSLVLQAGTRNCSRSLYLLDMGKPVKIANLARNMIVLSGLQPDKDIKIEFTGLRPGEKLIEELLTESEGAQKTEIEKIFIAKPGDEKPWEEIERDARRLGDLAERGDQHGIVDLLRRIIPDYIPASISYVPIDGGRVLEISSRAAEEDTDTGRHIVKRPSPSDYAPIPALKFEHPPLPPMPETDRFPMPAAGPVPTPATPFRIPDFAEDVPQEPEPASEAPTELAPADAFDRDLFADTPDATPVPVDIASPPAIAEALPEPAAEAKDEAQIELLLDAPAPDPTPAPEESTDTVSDVPIMKVAELPPPPRSGAIVVLRVSRVLEADTLELLLLQFRSQLGPDDHLVFLAEKTQELPLPPAEAVFRYGEGAPQGGVAAAIAADRPRAEMLLFATTDTIFTPGAIERLREAVRSAPLAYSDHIEDKNGEQKRIDAHDHNGCPHERFEFGPVTALSMEAVERAGGIRADLSFAWEYDLHLKLMEQAPFAHIAEPLYIHFLPPEEPAAPGKLHSPGKGPLGGFSYVFYPEDVEREVTSVFEQALRRRGAWIEHPAAAVDHSGRDYGTKASVVIPVLNRAKYIGNAIAKVVAGTFADFEILVVDNGSTDGTIEAVKEWESRDPRVRLLHGKGGSIASALNEGIRAARGKYICQLDSDDEYAPTTLEKMIGHLESHPHCGLAISYYRLMDEGGTPIEDVAPITHAGYSRNQILRRDGAGAVRIFPRAVLEEFGLYDEEHYGNFGEDYDMVLKTGEKYDVDRVHEVLYFYRRHSDNTDVTRDPAMKYHNKNRARQEALRRRIELNRAASQP